MATLLKWLVYLALLAGLALTAYSYVGPFFGADFSPRQEEMRVPVALDGL